MRMTPDIVRQGYTEMGMIPDIKVPTHDCL